MIVDSENKYKSFLKENINANCIFHIITNSNVIHNAIGRPLLLMVKNIDNDVIYIININHYDFTYKIELDTLLSDLNNLYCNKFVIDKKKFLHALPLKNLKDLQLVSFLEDGKIEEIQYIIPSYQFFYNKIRNNDNINQFIPSSVHLQYFESLCGLYEDNVELFKDDEIYNNINTEIIENLQKIEINGLYVDNDLFHQHFNDKNVNPIDNKVYTEYNIFTSTGRPSNRFGGVNYAALKKEDGCRSSFISRYGDDGMLLLIDYSAYHPHIVAKLINYELPSDAYRYLGKHYTGKDNITDEELKASKNLTFQCMYGNIPDELMDIPYFKKMSEYINHRWKYFNEFGYVETPIYKRRITKNHIADPNPNKLFNYILQASETEFGMSVLSNINQYLNDKLTKVVLYTYDSFLFDINKNDGKQTLFDIKKIMNDRGFPVKCYIGHNYDHMITVNI